MLLVIISVMASTVLTMSYLSSRDNSLAIGENAVEASVARWSAVSGIDLAVTALQSNTGWRTAASNGVLLNEYPFMGGELTVHVIDADTGDPPTYETVLVKLAALFNTGRLQQSAHAFAVIGTPTEGQFQLDLADFALFANEQIYMSNSSTVARWETAPRTSFGMPIRVGVRSNSSRSVRLAGSSAILDGVVYYPDGGAYDVIDSNYPIQPMPMNDAIPLPDAPRHGFAEPDSSTPDFNITLDMLIGSDATWNLATIGANRRLTIQNDTSIVIGDSLLIEDSGNIRVEANATLVVFGDVELRSNSYIEILPGATLRMYIAGSFNMEEAYIGRVRADPTIRNTSGTAPWMDPTRIQIFSFGSSNPNWKFDRTSVAMASIYAPQANVELDNTSALYGRLAAQKIRTRGDAKIFYDHSLDRFAGYANLRSLVFDAAGNIHEAFRDMTVIDTALLSDAADSANVQFQLFGMSLGTRGALYDGLSSSPSGSTLRPIAVDSQVLAVGIEPRSWEIVSP
jgi:hypothetical protein